MKTDIVPASSLIIQDETEFRPIISCQNVWGVARLGKWILWGPRTKSLITTAVEDSLIHTVMHRVLVCLAHTCYNSSYYANEERFSQ